MWHINVCVWFRYVCKSRSRSRPGCGLDLRPWPQIRSRSRPGHGLDLGLWPQIRSRSRPGCGLDLGLWPQIRSRSRPGYGPRSKPWPGLYLDLICGHSPRSKPWPGLDLDLIHSHHPRSKPQQGVDLDLDLHAYLNHIHTLMCHTHFGQSEAYIVEVYPKILCSINNLACFSLACLAWKVTPDRVKRWSVQPWKTFVNWW